MAERTGRIGVATNGKSAAEPVDSGSQILGRDPSAKSGVGDTRALEVLTFPCGGVGVSDRLCARIRSTEKLLDAIIEELCGDRVRYRERGHIGHRGACGVEGPYDV